MSDREGKFEKMLSDVLEQYTDTITKMAKLKEEGKVKTVSCLAILVWPKLRQAIK